jgi:hypothetical protein
MKRELMKWTIPLLLASVFLTEAKSVFAIAITGSATAPTTNIVESMSDLSDQQNMPLTWTGNGALQHLGVAQSWNHGTAYTVDKITVLMNPSTNAATFNGAAMHIRLYTWQAGGGGSAPLTGTPGTPFLNESGTLPNTFVNNTSQYITFDVTDTALLAGQEYGFVVDFTSAVAPGSGFNAGFNGNLIATGTSTFYPAGRTRSWEESNNDYNGIGPDDLVFFVQEVVPEPASATLAGIGVVGLIGIIRRRNCN